MVALGITRVRVSDEEKVETQKKKYGVVGRITRVRIGADKKVEKKSSGVVGRHY